MFNIDQNSTIPIYKQISNEILLALENGELSPGDKLPSLNHLKKELQLGKETIISAFGFLKELGIVESIQGKGYFITNHLLNEQHNIFLLFDNLTPYKQELYQSISKSLGNNGSVDIYFHHYNLEVFESLVKMSSGKYTEYVIIPPADINGLPVMDHLPKKKTYILDLGFKTRESKYASVCQDFENDVINALKTAKERLNKYNELILVFDEKGTHPFEITVGFMKFCHSNNIPFKIVPFLIDEPKSKQCYIIIEDKLLVDLIDKSNSRNLVIGEDIGVISYNDTPLKKIAANGITTLSTDFQAMGKTVVDLILTKKKEHLVNPSHLILRNSL